MKFAENRLQQTRCSLSLDFRSHLEKEILMQPYRLSDIHLLNLCSLARETDYEVSSLSACHMTQKG